MPGTAQLRGVLLEEVLLFLLRFSGYRTITETRIEDDPTLSPHAAGLSVKGRGARHQIDAIADSIVTPPFSHPQRLLVEAKCYRGKIGIGVVRNALGVLRDVSEHWVPSERGGPPMKRFHYQYALFSASGYSRDAEEYAFAQDIYLIPLAKSRFFAPIIDLIMDVGDVEFEGTPRRQDQKLSHVRRAVRARLQRLHHIHYPGDDNILEEYPAVFRVVTKLERVADSLKQALVGTINGQFPLLLVPNPATPPDLERLDIVDVRIFWDLGGWYLRDAHSHQLLYSFDLPEDLFRLYADQGVLTPKRALQLKEDWFTTIQATASFNGRVKVITFRLDRDWLRAVQNVLGSEPH